MSKPKKIYLKSNGYTTGADPSTVTTSFESNDPQTLQNKVNQLFDELKAQGKNPEINYIAVINFPYSPEQPLPQQEDFNIKRILSSTERDYIQTALAECLENKKEAAKRLGLQTRQLSDKIRQYGLDNEKAQQERMTNAIQMGRDLNLKKALTAVERTYIPKALLATNGNRSEAAQQLRITHRVLIYKMKEYNIN